MRTSPAGSIHDVTVTAVTGSGVDLCSLAGIYTAIEFVYEFGDLPMLTSDRTNLADSSNTGYGQFHYGYATFSEFYKGSLCHSTCLYVSSFGK